MKFELCAILLGSLTVTALDKAAREQLQLKLKLESRMNDFRVLKKTNLSFVVFFSSVLETIGLAVGHLFEGEEMPLRTGLIEG